MQLQSPEEMIDAIVHLSLHGNLVKNDGKVEKTNCYQCRHARSIPGDCHIGCAKPDKNITGAGHGILKGWFAYPVNFDPVWRTSECSNFEKQSE